MKKRICISDTIRETINIGKEFSLKLTAGDTVFLYGDVGAGKTVFIKGIAKGLHIPGVITSPSFTIINEYKGLLPLYHVDLYRLNAADIFFVGLDEYLYGKGITAVEWADRLNGSRYIPHWSIHIEHINAGTRKISIVKKKHDISD